jgi:secondary thiamine-phosphate synthase enzyme
MRPFDVSVSERSRIDGRRPDGSHKGPAAAAPNRERTTGGSSMRTIVPVKIVSTTLTVATKTRREIRDLTEEVAGLPGVDELAHGSILLHSLHTTTALFINEHQEALLHDIAALLERLIPAGGRYRHDDPAYSDCNRQNAASHLGAVLLGQTLQVPIEQGRLVLGTWQRLLFCELDGPQNRRVYAQVIGV